MNILTISHDPSTDQPLPPVIVMCHGGEQCVVDTTTLVTCGEEFSGPDDDLEA